MGRTYAITLSLAVTLFGTEIRADDMIWRSAGSTASDHQPTEPSAGGAPMIRGQSDEMDVPPLLGLRNNNTPDVLPPTMPEAVEVLPTPNKSEPEPAPRPVQPTTQPAGPWKTADPNVPSAAHPTFIAPPPYPSESRPFYSREISVVDESPFGLEPHVPGFVNRSYVRAEYLLWWVNRDIVPPLVTTGLPVGIDRLPPPGALGRPDTRVLIGDEDFEGGSPRHGMRVRAGTWLDQHGCGIDGSFWFLSPFRFNEEIPTGTFDVLSRPIFAPNPEIDGQFVELIAFPGLSVGGADVRYQSRLWGADANIRKCLCTKCDLRAELFGGFRYVGLEEDLEITEFLVALQGSVNPPPGTQIVVSDRFRTRNQFYGGQIGTNIERYYGRFVFDLRTSIALGVTQQQLNISGEQVLQTPDMQQAVFLGGLLTTPTNIGSFSRERFSVVPEINFNVGYQLSNNLRAYVGYNFLYWSRVVRPGGQVDLVVDVTQVPNPPGPEISPSGQNRPAVLFTETDLWVQGINFGIEARW